MFEFGKRVIKANDYKVVEAHIKKADQDTLIIFDVDEVLLQPKDQVLKIYNVNNMANLLKGLTTHLSIRQIWELESIILLEAEYEPVNSKILDLIADLQAKGIKVLGLTQLMTGEFGRIKSLVDWRIDQLTSLGYNLKNSWPDLVEKIFDQLPSIKYPECSPVFSRGVVFTCDHPKDKVLKLFLDYAGYFPKKIIFVDDIEKHIQDMMIFCARNNVDFMAILYDAAYHNQALNTFDKQRARLQIETLDKTHKWLSDAEADRQIK